MELKSNVPPGPLEQKWTRHKFDMKLVNPANKRKYSVIVVGLGPGRRRRPPPRWPSWATRSRASATRTAPAGRHSIAAQGGINAAKNYQNDGDSVYRLFYDTDQGRRLPLPRGQRLPPGRGLGQHHRPVRRAGRALRPRVRRHCWPTARSAAPRSRGPSTPAARPASSSCSGAYQALERQIGLGTVKMFPRHEMQELVVDRRPGPRHRRPRPGDRRDRVVRRRRRHPGHRRLRHGLLPGDLRQGLQRTAIWRAYKKGAAFANPCYTQIHPTCIPVTGEHQSKLTLMSESLRNDGRIWVPKKKGDTPAARPDPRGRARLLPRAEVPELRQPRAARHRLAGRQGGLRRGPGRRQDRAGRLPRLRRRHQPPRRRHDPRAVRQPVRHVRADHRRGPLQGADADLPRHPLHDGRALGRLQPDEHDPRPVRAGRGQLLRPRRQPPGRQRADAGAGRRLLRHPLHAGQLPRVEQARQGRAPTTRRSRSAEA